jgi:leukotriene-A4 hydrolase
MLKIRLFLFYLVSCLLILSNCSQSDDNQTMTSLPKDPHSYSEPNEAVVTHQHFDLNVDFEKKIIVGKTRLSIWNKTHRSQLILDTKGLKITGVYLEDEHHPTAYSYLHKDSILGNALKISISAEEKQDVLVFYETTKQSQALQWLNPGQTAGKKEPFLFTQGQAILSRSWFPCQDGPGIRFTYSAEVTVPSNLKAVMSAESQTRLSAGKFRFEMTKPIPAYLVALAVGNLDFKSIDKRTGIYAEPEILEKAVSEFADLGKMVEAAEGLYGSYRWGRYDVLVLPPSFPFGGMENPCVTFATPTILAGDRSLTSLIAHELAHSWSGNLVTNSTWDDFWLNEGFTVYFERRIMEKLRGADYAQMLASIGYGDLEGTLEEFGNTSPATCLKLNLKGTDPDDGMNDIAYEKGYLFLCHLEKLVGREKWDYFLKTYFDKHAFQSLSTEGFVSYLNENLLVSEKVDTLAAVQEWIYIPGLPATVKKPVSILFDAAETVAGKFAKTSEMDEKVTSNWSSHEWLHFLRSMPKDLVAKKMALLDSKFLFTNSSNSEVLFEWLMLSIQNNYQPASAALEEFLVHTGRRKFVVPLYKALLKTPNGKETAMKIYAKARENYHAVTYQTVDGILNTP